MLGIHLFGPGNGESILLEMPPEKGYTKPQWGMVDSLVLKHESKRLVPPLKFMLARGGNVLEFACMTHPHEDHFMGFSEVLACTDIQVRRWWENQGLDHRALVRFYEDLGKYSADFSHRRVYRELAGIEKAVKALIESDASRYRVLGDYNQEIWGYQCSDNRELRIAVLGPPATRVREYSRNFAATLKKWNADQSHGSILDMEEFARDLQNMVSVVLLIQYGSTRLLLGGDADILSWEEIMGHEERVRQKESVACTMLKISHHGSASSFCTSAWDEHGNPLGLITPFTRHKLPKPEMLDEFAKRCISLHVSSESPKESSFAPVRSRTLRMGKYNCRPVSQDKTIGISVWCDDSGGIDHTSPICLGDCI